MMSKCDSDLQFKYEWQKLVCDTLAEPDSKRLVARLKAANRAICTRLNDPTTEFAERMALSDARGLIRIFSSCVGIKTGNRVRKFQGMNGENGVQTTEKAIKNA